MKITGASMTRTLAVEPPTLNRIKKISACFRKLSLNAAKNCVQNRGAKRRVISKDVDINLYSPRGSPSYRYRPKVTFILNRCRGSCYEHCSRTKHIRERCSSQFLNIVQKTWRTKNSDCKSAS